MEVEERNVTPYGTVKEESARKTSRPLANVSTIESIAEVKKDETDDEVEDAFVEKTWKDRRPSIQPRMTKAAVMRRQSIVGNPMFELKESGPSAFES